MKGQLARRSALAAVALAAGFAGLAGFATAAQAGTYKVYSCTTPSGPATPPLAGWRITSTHPRLGWWKNACRDRGLLYLRLDSRKVNPDGETVAAEFRPAPDTSIASYRVHRSVDVASGTPYSYTQSDIRGGRSTVLDHCWGPSSCNGIGTASKPLAASNVMQFARPNADISAVRFTVGCSSKERVNCPAVKGNGVELRIYRGEFTISDNILPVLTAPPAGPWFNSAKPLTGEQPVSIAATDRGGGVYQAQFEVDGQVVQRETINDNGGLCVEPFTHTAPCPSVGGGTVSFNTAAVPDGEHQLRILVSDAAGNTAPWGPVTIRTRNAACDPGPPAADLRIRAGLARRGTPRRRLTVGYGERVRIVGRLTRTDGTPVAGAPLCVAQKLLGQASRDVNEGPTTDSDGRFSYRVERGPSRTVWIVHRVSGAAAAKRLKLAVRPRVSFRPSDRSLRNGDRVGFRGRISGPVPERGALVEIQVDRGDHWQTFTRGRANRKGRFTASYRFSRTLGVANFRFRAHVPRQGAYPYESGSSRPAVVQVDG